ncbi:DnaD domain-containing protein [Clostridium tagluense]|uniref:DnaD domain-containing protein n=1 Tax=Clostridium tagluense TaxID=360422 RepID=UPI001CF30E0A|nr:DnaD domain protein [Clostridium tagluense]MCB2300236.1 DnaD domain protein [Clostridium tagluense]
MAKYRQLYTEFWSDGFVMDLTPEEKFFYLYLMTNSKTSQCGIYELPKQIIVTETGYNRETIDKLLTRFCEYEKIIYCDETKEIMILNWIKYNEPNNINAIKCVNKELSKVKKSKFIEILYQQCEAYELEVEKIFEGLYRGVQGATTYTPNNKSVCDKISCDNQKYEENQSFSPLHSSEERSYEGAYKGLPSNKVISNKEEIISNKQKEINKKEEVVSAKKNFIPDIKSVIKVFENNIHPMTPLEHKKLMDFTRDVNCEVIIMAIEEAVKYNARTIKYITKILDCWISRGIKTADCVRAYQREWDNKKNSSSNGNIKKGTFCDYDQRQYDFDELERKLLGWSLPEQEGD